MLRKLLDLYPFQKPDVATFKKEECMAAINLVCLKGALVRMEYFWQQKLARPKSC